MKVRFHEAAIKGRPVVVSTTQTIEAGQLVQVDANGKVVVAANNATSGLAVAADQYPDSEYEGTKTQVGLWKLEDCEVIVPFTNTSTLETLAQADIDAGPFAYDSTADKIDLTTGSGSFIPTGVYYGTSIGDRSGYLIGRFIDSACFGGN